MQVVQGQPRVEDRTRALVKARLRAAGPEREICILDISTRGLLATAARPPGRGEFVEMTVNGHTLVGQVKWASARRFGVALRGRISVIGLVAGDGQSIALERTTGARKRSNGLIEALRQNLSNLGSVVQFAMIVAALGFGAFLLSDYVADGLSSLGEAKLAMSGEGGD